MGIWASYVRSPLRMTPSLMLDLTDNATPQLRLQTNNFTTRRDRTQSAYIHNSTSNILSHQTIPEETDTIINEDNRPKVSQRCSLESKLDEERAKIKRENSLKIQMGEASISPITPLRPRNGSKKDRPASLHEKFAKVSLNEQFDGREQDQSHIQNQNAAETYETEMETDTPTTISAMNIQPQILDPQPNTSQTHTLTNSTLVGSNTPQFNTMLSFDSSVPNPSSNSSERGSVKANSVIECDLNQISRLPPSLSHSVSVNSYKSEMDTIQEVEMRYDGEIKL